MNKLYELWEQQITYNKKIRNLEFPDNKEYWTKQYLLGIASEINEILQEINWKIHRRGHATNRHNLARELADITKYIWCLWELHGFTVSDMLDFVEEKTNELKEQHKQDFDYIPSPGVPIIITDIDGTIGDFRDAFCNWLVENNIKISTTDKATTLSMEIDINIPFQLYFPLKEKFESEGGYKLLKPYTDAVTFLRNAWQNGTDIIVYTARPITRFHRIWADTWHWLEKYKIPAKELRIGSEERISRACQLQSEGHKVLLLEDDPSLALRAASAGISVVLREQPYNAGIVHKNILRIKKFTEILK